MQVQEHKKTSYDSKAGGAPIRCVIWRSLIVAAIVSQHHAVGNGYLELPGNTLCAIDGISYPCILGAPNALGSSLFAAKYRLGENLPNIFRFWGVPEYFGQKMHYPDLPILGVLIFLGLF